MSEDDRAPSHPHRALSLSKGQATSGPESESSITVDGRTVLVRPGQSVAAALIGAGITSWRTTRGYGRPRGVFCGIGACFDCLVRIDDAPPVRACLVPVRDGMIIHTDRPEPVTEVRS